VAQLSATLADAFATDPILQWLAPSQRSDRRLRRLLAIELEYYVFPAGRVLTTGDFPRCEPRAVARQVGDDGAALGRDRLCARFRPPAAPGEATTETLRGHPPPGTALLIRYLGVATRFQGQGLGTALLGPTLDRCDGEGVPAYLEASTERSAALYNRLGFVHLGELRVPNGPRFWPMRRPPAAAYATRTLVASGMEGASRSEGNRHWAARRSSRRALRANHRGLR
jgi:GNAT superfamily N-acetyltransferase